MLHFFQSPLGPTEVGVRIYTGSEGTRSGFSGGRDMPEACAQQLAENSCSENYGRVLIMI